MAVVKWEFYDPETDDSYTFEINPNEGGSPQFIKKLQYQATAAPDGVILAFEGRDEPKTTDFGGTILSRAQYDAMVAWFSKRHVIQYTDDLGRVFQIYITNFEPKRARSHQYPWKHTYSVKCLVMSFTEP